MNRKRRHACRVVELRKLDQPVFMAAYTQDTQNWRLWHGRRLTLRKAQDMVAAGEAAEVTRKTANGIETFYQETQPSRASQPTPTTLTLATMNAVSRRGERDLTGPERRELDKVTMWPFERDKRNEATIGPRVTERERIQACQLMDRVRGVRPKFAAHTGRFATVRTWHAPAAQTAT